MPQHAGKVLDRFFLPESIAIMGVSREAGMFGGTSFLQRYCDAGYAGRLYPINPKADNVLGIKAYPTLVSLPETPDLVMIAVRANLVPAALEECAARGARHIHILSAGFREIGTDEGRQLEKKVADIAREHQLLIMGPNCMGPYCPSVHLTAWGAIPGRNGNLGVISQSGGITQRFTEYISSLGVGVNKAASIGNACVLDSPDFLEFMAQDESIHLIALYLESISDGRRFFDLAGDVSPRKPVILLKGGQSEQGAKTVESHTGRMAGDQRLWQALCEQTGIVSVNDMNEWVDACLAFSFLPQAKGRGTMIVGGGGGNSVIFSDQCIRLGLDVPGLSEQSVQRIRPLVPAAGSIAGNPLDYWAVFLQTELLFEVLDMAYRDANIALVIVDRLIPRLAFHSPDVPDSVFEIADFIKSHSQAKPTVFTVDYDGGDPELIRKGAALRSGFCEAGIPAFPSFERAVRALAHFTKYCARFAGNEKS